MSFSISSGPAAVKPKCLPMSSNSTGKWFRWTAEFICPAKKPIPQWSFHRKCFPLDPQPQQDRYGTEYQSSPFLPFLTLEGPPSPWWFWHSVRLPYVWQLWNGGSSLRARQEAEGYVGLSLPSSSNFFFPLSFKFFLSHQWLEKTVGDFSHPP